MIIETRLRKIGNSWGVLLPKKVIANFVPNEKIKIDVLSVGESKEVEPKIPEKIIEVAEIKKDFTTHSSSSRFELCKKHHGSMKTTCGCE